jgi:class 3 adenylate cyclase
MALDEVLMRKEASVAVMFTDMRNFSTRSVDTDFVEQELVPSSSKIIDGAEDNMGVAKQIGDAVFVYYSMEDPEEGLLRAAKDSVKGCMDEKQRIKTLGRAEPERFFSIAYGSALVGNMASFRHREATVIGSPANLSARMDTLTKEPAFKILIGDGNKVLVSKTAKEILKTFNDKLEFNEVNLEDIKLIMKSFPDEKSIYLFATTAENIAALNEVLAVNNLAPIL